MRGCSQPLTLSPGFKEVPTLDPEYHPYGASQASPELRRRMDIIGNRSLRLASRASRASRHVDRAAVLVPQQSVPHRTALHPHRLRRATVGKYQDRDLQRITECRDLTERIAQLPFLRPPVRDDARTARVEHQGRRVGCIARRWLGQLGAGNAAAVDVDGPRQSAARAGSRSRCRMWRTPRRTGRGLCPDKICTDRAPTNELYFFVA